MICQNFSLVACHASFGQIFDKFMSIKCQIAHNDDGNILGQEKQSKDK